MILTCNEKLDSIRQAKREREAGITSDESIYTWKMGGEKGPEDTLSRVKYDQEEEDKCFDDWLRIKYLKSV